MTLPIALAGKDLIGQAKTGTGKTLGFGIPLLATVAARKTDDVGRPPLALVIVPTRELAIQVADDLTKAAANLDLSILSVYGGKSYEPQIAALEKGVDVIVGTPGRLIDLMKQRHLNLKSVRVLVLDEADEMLDMGFLPDVENLVSNLPTSRHTMLFSATMPGQIVALARRYMSQPTHIRATDPTSESSVVDAIEQHVWRAHQLDKPELVARVLQATGRGLTIIFCRTKRVASSLSDDLSNRGFAVGSVHGDLGQGAREQALRAFRSGKVDVLVATDVAARGIDVADVTHVINYECPEDDKTYVHRIGRTGRAGNAGVAITLVDWQDTARWQMINRTLGLPFNDPLETYSSSPHVYAGLGIPEGITGQLPRSGQTRAGLAAEEIEDLGETGKRKNKQGAGNSQSRNPQSRGQRGTKSDSRNSNQGSDREKSRAKQTKPSGDVEPKTDAKQNSDSGTKQRPARKRTRRTPEAN
ncbi:MAG: DEAD/DEAH box helicase [Actinomycetales bacterium]|nr:DEAD/DEAH box helicase [Actinomycetales bacterium]